jgi:hypothetical protein
MKRDHARKLLALARANREVACVVAERASEHLKETQKAAEILRAQEVVAKARVKVTYQHIGTLLAALTQLGMPEISLSNNEVDNDGDPDSEADSEAGEGTIYLGSQDQDVFFTF